MQWSLVLLLLMGQSFCFTCGLYEHEFHFIDVKKTWEEAQAYCRENYTDLATVRDLTDMRRLQNSTQNGGEAWIGLYSSPGGGNRTWHWSLPGVGEYSENKSNWHSGEPNDNPHPENCVITTDTWTDYPCSYTLGFICYNETMKDNKTFYKIELNKNWTQAQSYCRQHHTDLVSGLDQIPSKEFKDLNKAAAFWIGLFRDTWRWSDGSNSSLRLWDSFKDGLSTRECGTTLLDGSGRWSSAGCDQRKPFFCYEDPLILIRENKTWEDALSYCRENHHDLVTISNLHEQKWVQERAKGASTPFVWLGLRYPCILDLWFWVNDNLLCYENWASGGKISDCGMSAAVVRGQGGWVSQRGNEMFNFICSKH